MDELVEWLRAQLDWQEDIARRARDADEAADRLFAGHCSPNWTLREVEAKRRRLERHKPGYASDEVEYDNHYEVLRREDGKTVEILVQDDQPREPYWCRTCGEFAPCPELRDDASVYSDRPGYRSEWAPSDT